MEEALDACLDDRSVEIAIHRPSARNDGERFLWQLEGEDTSRYLFPVHVVEFQLDVDPEQEAEGESCLDRAVRAANGLCSRYSDQSLIDAVLRVLMRLGEYPTEAIASVKSEHEFMQLTAELYTELDGKAKDAKVMCRYWPVDEGSHLLVPPCPEGSTCYRPSQLAACWIELEAGGTGDALTGGFSGHMRCP